MGKAGRARPRGGCRAWPGLGVFQEFRGNEVDSMSGGKNGQLTGNPFSLVLQKPWVTLMKSQASEALLGRASKCPQPREHQRGEEQGGKQSPGPHLAAMVATFSIQAMI